jgi:hypothetical protein
VISGWHHVVGISDGNAWSVFIDGQLESVTVMEGYNNGEWFNDFSGDTYSIGALDRPSPIFYQGYIDEVRVSSTIENQQWIFTSYNNQNNPSSFLTFGPEIPGP